MTSPTSEPGRLVDSFELADGRRMSIRTTVAADAERICELYGAMGPGDRHRRFFSAFRPHLEWCRDWVTVGERGGFGVIATVTPERDDLSVSTDPEVGPSDEVVVAEAGYALRSDGDGDLAITVATGWRGWLGPYLLDVLVRHAAEVGVANLQADVLLENGPMLSLLRRRDPVALGHDDGMVHLSVGTGAATPSWPPDEDRPRVLIEVAGRRWAGERAAEAAGLATAMCSGPAGRRYQGCPVLDGGRCPLADDADAIIVLLDPHDDRTTALLDAHRRAVPGRPVLARRSSAPDGPREQGAHGCTEVAGDGASAVSQLLALIGRRQGA